MRAIFVLLAVATLPGCWEGHNSCGIAPPMGAYDDEAPADPPPPPPPHADLWTPTGIGLSLHENPADAMHAMVHGPILVADADASSSSPLCHGSADAAIDAFAERLGPSHGAPACSEVEAAKQRTLVCIRPHDGSEFVAVAFLRRHADWELALLMKGSAPDPAVSQEILAALPTVSCR